MDFFEWFNYGLDNQYITWPYCGAHSDVPMSRTEVLQEEMTGDAPCIPVARFLYGLQALEIDTVI